MVVMRVCRGWEDGLLSEKSAGYNNVIGIAPPYGDGDHINRITGVPMGGGGSAHDHITERALCECCKGRAVNDRARTDLIIPSRGEEVIQKPLASPHLNKKKRKKESTGTRTNP